jgi:hypothetical protein
MSTSDSSDGADTAGRSPTPRPARVPALRRLGEVRPMRSVPALLGLFAGSRVLLLACVLKLIVVPGPDITSDVSGIYHGWYEVLRTGAFPATDVTWQYPPAAALAMLSPALLPFLDYASAFFWLVCAVDVLTLVLLMRAGRGGRDAERRPTAGAWVWVLGVPLIGPTVYARYDMMVTAVAVAALLAAARRPRVAGALTALGAMLKVWPVLLLTGVRDRRLLAWAVGLGALVALGSAAFLPGSFAFLTFQRDRGTEVESLGGLVFHLARYTGHWNGEVLLNYGSVEFIGPYVDVVSHVAVALTVSAFCWLLVWRLRVLRFTAATAADAALTAVLMFVTTSRVVSPQYLVWLVGLAAVCVTLRASVQLLPAWLVLAAAAVTGYEFPVHFGDLAGTTTLGLTVLLLRNGLLVTASVIACRRLWAGYVPDSPRVEGLVAPRRGDALDGGRVRTEEQVQDAGRGGVGDVGDSEPALHADEGVRIAGEAQGMGVGASFDPAAQGAAEGAGEGREDGGGRRQAEQ